MSSLVPRPAGDRSDLSVRQLGRARRIAAGAELTVFRHTVEAQALAAMDAADSQALGDVARYALDEELSLLSDGVARAGGSQAKLQLVAEKVNLVAQANSRRISRRFG